ncbi:hypothetical protein SMALA_5762 [Streptomyces malaysiensis subsp. malaysiensis]|nr:hypothetical protein SMALA_5762 [Streptomyces malaysiensis]
MGIGYAESGSGSGPESTRDQANEALTSTPCSAARRRRSSSSDCSTSTRKSSPVSRARMRSDLVFSMRCRMPAVNASMLRPLVVGRWHGGVPTAGRSRAALADGNDSQRCRGQGVIAGVQSSSPPRPRRKPPVPKESEFGVPAAAAPPPRP